MMRTSSNNSDPRQTISSILWVVAVIFCLWMSRATAAAQVNSDKATVTSSAPGAILYRGGAQSALRDKASLQPDDVIDTRAGGRVVIALGDGSQVVVYPGSRVELKNFRTGVPWRDLLKVTVGRVHATISHRLRRPNPYRVFSPIASIAVRGTDFLVVVGPSGETRVLVYEGLVEVGSLVNPQKTVLVRPGRNIIVRPDGDISTVTAAPRGELNEIRTLRYGLVGGQPEVLLRAAYDSHGSSYTGLRPSRFTAFSDSHLDGLQNPAYATEFRQPSGRFYLTPSFSPESGQYKSIPGSYTLSPQGSYFMPLGSRIVVGAGAAVTQTDIGVAETENYFNRLNQSLEYSQFEGDVKFTTANLSVIAARRFGRAGRTSFGVKFDYLIDRSLYSFSRATSGPRNSKPAVEEGEARGRRAGLSVGVTQDIGDDKKLGIYYRYSSGSVVDDTRRSEYWDDRSGVPQYFPGGAYFRTRPGYSSEAGLLFRGSATRRLFYGVESSILSEQDQTEFQTPFSRTLGPLTFISTQTYLNNRRVRQGMIGAGIGYALRPRTVLSLDVSTGRARQDSLGQTHYAFLPPGIRVNSYDDYSRERSSFRAWHIGAQTDVWRNLFAGAGLFYMWERKRFGEGLYIPQEFRAQTYSYSQEYSTSEKFKFLHYSAGWRLTPTWIAQYVYSASYSFSYGRYAPSHTLMLRYQFGRREEN